MGFRHSIRTKNKLYKYYLNKPAVFNEINYKQYRNKLNCLVNIAEKHTTSTSFTSTRVT